MDKGGVFGEAEGSSSEVGVETRKSMNDQGYENDLYKKLWLACAGPLVDVPRAGDKVFYFPQGYMEQVKACTNKDCEAEMPIYNLPSKILCKVVCVQLKADAGTDEVFAHITLLPVAEQDELSSHDDGNSLSLPQKACALSFSKKVTQSDRKTHGGFFVPKRHAAECLPPLDMSQDGPRQELLAKDLHGNEWHFCHVYRGHPKRHLLTTGWSAFVTTKKLVAGDTFILLRGGEGEFRAGIRRATKLANNASTTIISAHSMQHGILVSAFYAISTGTMFTVYYYPWTSPTGFIIPFDQYMKSAEIDYSVGTRFRMQFEGEECPQRFDGTVVGIEDVDHIRWPASEWRNLKVKWDATSDALKLPERVSHWNLEPMEAVRKKCTTFLPRAKRACTSDASLPWSPSLVKYGLLHSLVGYAPQSHSEVFQGQERRDTGVNELGALKLPLIPFLTSPPNPDRNSTQWGLQNQLHFPINSPFYPCPSCTVSFSGGNIVRLGLPNSWWPTLGSHEIHEIAAGSRNLSVPSVNSRNSGSQDQRTLELKDANEVQLAPQNGGHRHMLFGVHLGNNPPELPSPQVAPPRELESFYSTPLTSQSSVSEPSKSTSGINSEHLCKNCFSTTNRNCMKVFKYGTTLLKSVDLTKFDGYDALICELDKMFDFKGSLIDGSSGWQVTFTDDEGDMKTARDYPWKKLKFKVQRMFISPKEDIDKLNPSSPNPMP